MHVVWCSKIAKHLHIINIHTNWGPNTTTEITGALVRSAWKLSTQLPEFTQNNVLSRRFDSCTHWKRTRCSLLAYSSFPRRIISAPNYCKPPTFHPFRCWPTRPCVGSNDALCFVCIASPGGFGCKRNKTLMSMCGCVCMLNCKKDGVFMRMK